MFLTGGRKEEVAISNGLLVVMLMPFNSMEYCMNSGLKEKVQLGDRVETLQFQRDPKSLGCKQQNSTHKSYINTKGKGEDEAI